MTGRRFGRLMVLSQAPNLRTRVRWHCRCDCGRVVICWGSHLRAGASKSCGCWQREVTATMNRVHGNTDALINRLFDTRKRAAGHRGIPWELTREEVAQLAPLNCRYCGQEPQAIVKSGNRQMKYNGIDRVDNSRGYVSVMLVPCCFICNRAKSTRSEADFVAWIKQVFAVMVSSPKS